MKSEDCRALIKKYSDAQQLGELSQNIGVSKTVLSLIANGKYQHNPAAVEKKIADYASRQTMTFKDERRLVQIYAIIDEADSPESLRAAIAWQR